MLDRGCALILGLDGCYIISPNAPERGANTTFPFDPSGTPAHAAELVDAVRWVFGAAAILHEVARSDAEAGAKKGNRNAGFTRGGNQRRAPGD